MQYFPVLLIAVYSRPGFVATQQEKNMFELRKLFAAHSGPSQLAQSPRAEKLGVGRWNLTRNMAQCVTHIRISVMFRFCYIVRATVSLASIEGRQH